MENGFPSMVMVDLLIIGCILVKFEGYIYKLLTWYSHQACPRFVIKANKALLCVAVLVKPLGIPFKLGNSRHIKKKFLAPVPEWSIVYVEF